MNKTLRVWYIPQVPWTPYHYYVSNPYEWKVVLDAITWLSQFEYSNRIKPDYADAGWLETFATLESYAFAAKELSDPELDRFCSEYGFEKSDIKKINGVLWVWEEWYNDEGESIDEVEF